MFHFQKEFIIIMLFGVVFYCTETLVFQFNNTLLELDENIAYQTIMQMFFILIGAGFIWLSFLFLFRINYRQQVQTTLLNKALQKNLTNKEHLIEWAQIGMAIVKQDHFIYTNSMMSELFGFTAQEFLEKTFTSMLIEKETFSLEKIKNLKNKEALSYEFPLKRKQSGSLLCRIRINLIEPHTYLFLIDDISSYQEKIEFAKDYTALFSVLSSLRSFDSKKDENQMIKTVLQSILRAYDFSVAFFGVIKDEKIYFNIMAGDIKKNKPILPYIDLNDPIHQQSAMAQVYLKKKPFGYGNTSRVEYYKKYWLDLDKNLFNSSYAFPLVINGVVEGYITFFSARKNQFSHHRPKRLENLMRELCKNIEEHRARILTHTAIRNYEDRLRTQIQELEKSKTIMEQQASDMNRMISDLMTAKDLAEEANKAKTQFLANVSHELRTPLNAILGFSETIQMETFGPIKNPKYKDYIGYIYSSGNHLLSLINDILDISKVEVGHQKIEEQKVDLNELFNALYNIVQHYPTGDQKNISFKVSSNIWGIYADERMIKQIMLNLLSNAIKFTPNGGNIDFSATMKKDTKELVLIVKDTGIGIPKDKLKSIFMPFVQVENILTRAHTGSGLGLTLVKKLMELHHGRVHIKSTPGHGSIVQLYFPSSRLILKKVKK